MFTQGQSAFISWLTSNFPQNYQNILLFRSFDSNLRGPKVICVHVPPLRRKEGGPTIHSFVTLHCLACSRGGGNFGKLFKLTDRKKVNEARQITKTCDSTVSIAHPERYLSVSPLPFILSLSCFLSR